MKQVIQRTSFLLFTILSGILLLAQEKDKGIDVDIDVNKEESTWYQQPWVWVVGVAVFILLLAAILRGGGKKE